MAYDWIRMMHSSMPTLYLTHPGCTLRYTNRCFQAEAPGQPALATPTFRVDAVVAFGAIHLTYPAISRLLASRTPVFFLTRFGTPRG
jgi:CRISPR/Cas system-associated endonuclease Cas1